MDPFAHYSAKILNLGTKYLTGALVFALCLGLPKRLPCNFYPKCYLSLNLTLSYKIGALALRLRLKVPQSETRPILIGY